MDHGFGAGGGFLVVLAEAALAEGVAEISSLEGLNLRQAYLRLGIAKEPKSRANSAHVGELPAHVRLASELLVAIKQDAPTLRHPRKSYRTRELRAHLSALGLEVGTKDIRRFCTRHNILRDIRAGRPRSRPTRISPELALRLA